MKTATIELTSGVVVTIPNFENVLEADFGTSSFVRIISSKRNDYYPLHNIISIKVVDE